MRRIRLDLAWTAAACQCKGRYDTTFVTRLCFQYLAIYSNENLPKSIQIVPKSVKCFAQNQKKVKHIAKDLKVFAKVVEFRQIWSHWHTTPSILWRLITAK